MSDCNLYNTINAYNNAQSRFHMPGHSGNLPYALSAQHDITELPFSDNLLSASGVILESEHNLATAYGSQHALIFTQGATSVIFAALYALKVDGKAVAVDSKAHRAIYAAAELLSVDIVVYDYSTFHRLNLSEIGVILITSPDYCGYVVDYNQVAETARANGIGIILDESHGSHYAYSTLLPSQCYDNIDIIASSMHKTLPCLTGSAIARTYDNAVYDRLLYSRSLTHSTSPNYMIMCSMDKARSIMQDSGEELYLSVKDDICSFISSIDSRYYRVIDNSDFTRVILATASSQSLSQHLAGYGIYPELTLARHIVLIVTPYNAHTLASLSLIINDIAAIGGIEPLSSAVDYSYIAEVSQPAPDLSSRHATDSEIIDISSAIGRVASARVGLYPPGTPLIHVGEVITADMVNYININFNHIFGLIKGKIKVYTLKG